MPEKRKRLSHHHSKNKKPHRESTEIELDDPDVYRVKEILSEDTKRYKISWEPVNGVNYSPTWEPKENVNQAAIEDWEDKKHLRRPKHTERSAREGKGIAIPKTSPPNTQSSTPPRPLIRLRRPTKPSAAPSPPSLSASSSPRPTASSLFETPSPSQGSEGAFRGTRSRRIQVEVSPLRSSQRNLYNDGSLADFPSSQIITGTAPETVSLSQQTDESIYVPETKRRSVIPDSQSGNTTLVNASGNADSITTNSNAILSNIPVHHGRQEEPVLSAETQSHSASIKEASIIYVSSGVVEDSQLANEVPSSPEPSAVTSTSERYRFGTPKRHNFREHSRDSSISALTANAPELAKSLQFKQYSGRTSTSPHTHSELGSPFQASREELKEHSSDSPYPQNSNGDPVFATQVSRLPSSVSDQAKRTTGALLETIYNTFWGRKGEDSQAPKANKESTSESPLPEPPSHYPDTFNSAPDRPPSISDIPKTPEANMTTESIEKPDEDARIQELRDAGGPITPAQRSLGVTTRSGNRAASPAGLRGGRSPSAVPPAEVIPMPSEEENRTSERCETLFPDQDQTRRKSTLPAGITDGDSIDSRAVSEAENGNEVQVTEQSLDGSDSGTETEFAVPVFLLAQQRDHYKNSVVWKKSFIEDFLEQTWPDGSPMLSEASDLITRLHQILSHPDLMNEETFSQVDAEPSKKAQYDKSQSAKILFISMLFKELADSDLHIVIDVTAGRLLTILDHFLAGIGVQHAVAGVPSLLDQTKLRVTLVPKDSPATGIPKAHLVIAFEGSTTLIEDERKVLRTLPEGRIAPLIYLVVPRSVEHIEREMRTKKLDRQPYNKRLTILIENIVRLRSEAGHRQVHDQDRVNGVASLARFVVDGGSSTDWPMDDLPDLKVFNSFTESQATTESELISQGNKTLKRSHEDDVSNDMESKKPRVHDQTGLLPITGPILESSGIGALMGTGTEFALDLAAVQQDHETREALLAGELITLKQTLQEHVSALESLQYRYEDQRNEIVKVQTERDEALESVNNMSARAESRESLFIKVKADREEYKTRLAAAEAALTSHSVPEIVEFEALKTRTAEAEKEKGRLEARIKNLTSDLEYIRNLYQENSAKGSQIIEERNELESRVADLEKQASDKRNEALRLTADKSHKQLAAEIRRLKLLLADREQVLAKRDEEMARLREKDRGRMTTRGGSVPRSPLGSPMRLEPPRSTGGMSTSRGGSPIRRSSPAVGLISSSAKSKLGR